MSAVDWLFDFFGVCRKHRTRTQWYECPACLLDARKREADLIDQAESVYFGH